MMSRVYYGEENPVVVVRDDKKKKTGVHRLSGGGQSQEGLTSLKLIKKRTTGVDIELDLMDSESIIPEAERPSQKIYVTKKAIKENKFVNHHTITEAKKPDERRKSRESMLNSTLNEGGASVVIHPKN